MKKRILCLGVALLLCAALAVPPGTAARRSDTPAPDCHEMARQWFGARLLDTEDPDSPAAAALLWFAQREADYLGPGAAVLPDRASLLDAETGEEEDPAPVEVPAGDEAARDRAARLEGIAAMQERLEIAVTDADVTARVDSSLTAFNPDGTVTLYVYEWTFLDYDDLSDGPGGTDVAGFGTWHKLTMEPWGDTWRTVRDEYDETDLLGVCTVTEETRNDPEAAFLDDMRPLPEEEETGPLPEGVEAGTGPEGGDAPSDLEGDGTAVLLSPVFYEGYNPDAAAQYADTYTLSYNPAFPNYNPVGGDCANFTSQSIYAGGMPMVQGASGWYHRLNSTSVYSARSASWTFARKLCDWMAANRGILVEAADDTVLKGSPCFYNNKGHATICVGQNSAGRPIIDSHNSDRFHLPWNYWITSTVYTVQLTGTSDLPLSIVGERCPQGMLGKGSGFGLRGVIRSNAVITEVSADVRDADGTAVLHYQTAWNDYLYDIQRDGLNDSFVFDGLDNGSYTYVVRAADASGADLVLIESSFTVEGSDLSITGESRPSGTLQKGDSFRLTGVISSNFTITQVSAYIYGSSDAPVMQYQRNWDKTSYNIRSDGLNSAFVFNNLDRGSYTYVVRATDASEITKELINAPFSVTSLPDAPDAPAVRVDGTQVTLSWTVLDEAAYYEAALTATDLEAPSYSQTTEESTAVFEDVRPGTYQASVTAYVGGEALQSVDTAALVSGSSGLGLAADSPQYSGEQVSIPVTVSNGGSGEVQGCMAAALYQGERMLACSLSAGLSIPGSGLVPVTASIPCGEADWQAGSLTAKLFLLDGENACPVTDALVVEF